MAAALGKLDEALRRIVARVAVLNITYFASSSAWRSPSVPFRYSPIASIF